MLEHTAERKRGRNGSSHHSGRTEKHTQTPTNHLKRFRSYVLGTAPFGTSPSNPYRYGKGSCYISLTRANGTVTTQFWEGRRGEALVIISFEVETRKGNCRVLDVDGEERASFKLSRSATRETDRAFCSFLDSVSEGKSLANACSILLDAG